MAKTLREIVNERNAFGSFVGHGATLGLTTVLVYAWTGDFQQSVSAGCGAYVGVSLLAPLLEYSCGKVYESGKKALGKTD